LLTKRPQNFRRYLPEAWRDNPPANVWGLTTVESENYLWRIDALKTVPFAVHGLSLEPLLGDLPHLREHLDGIEWVIVGGESGAEARPMHPDWARRIRDCCVEMGIPFHFKQWGQHNADLVHIGKQAAGHLLDGREWQEFPEVREMDGCGGVGVREEAPAA
jgi:protein gp37